MKVVVIGATGQLGQDLLLTYQGDAIGLSHQDVDVSDGVGLLTTLQALKPDWVINTAAFHNVGDCERNPSLAFAVNALGAANVARATEAVGAGVVFFSTDYVFSGAGRMRRQPHTENDGPAPLNTYGVSKLAGEQLVGQHNPRHLIVRTSGLFGTTTSRKGWTFPELMLFKARSGEHLRVVDDQVLSPTYTSDLSAGVKTLIAQGATGLVHLTNTDECSWYELACRTLELAGVEATIEPVPTAVSPSQPKRPSYSAMRSDRLIEFGVEPLRPWSDALADYLQAKALV
jgi:dTDP-4-dehydrorhamnose reductase